MKTIQQGSESECKHLLLIDDERDIRESLRQILEFEGYKVSTASNGKEGIQRLDEGSHPCVILVDLMMPVMDGWQFIEELRENGNYNAIPVLVVSAFAEKAKDLLCAGIVKKPFDVEFLLSSIQQHCGRRHL